MAADRFVTPHCIALGHGIMTGVEAIPIVGGLSKVARKGAVRLTEDLTQRIVEGAVRRAERKAKQVEKMAEELGGGPGKGAVASTPSPTPTPDPARTPVPVGGDPKPPTEDPFRGGGGSEGGGPPPSTPPSKKPVGNEPEISIAPDAEPLGTGGNKDVYPVKDRDDIVAAVHRQGDRQALEAEVATLNQLKEAGLPTVDVKGVVDIEGKPALIMERMAEGSKDIVRTNPKTRNPEKVGDSQALNERSIADLEAIRTTLVQKEIKVDDLQFLIGKDGRVVISDPLKIRMESKPKPSDINMKTIQKLIDVAHDNTAKRK